MLLAASERFRQAVRPPTMTDEGRRANRVEETRGLPSEDVPDPERGWLMPTLL